MGDPSGGYFEIYTTNDGGNNWSRVSQANIPDPIAEEYGILSLYTVVGNTIWFTTTKGRIYKSIDLRIMYLRINLCAPRVETEISFLSKLLPCLIALTVFPFAQTFSRDGSPVLELPLRGSPCEPDLSAISCSLESPCSPTSIRQPAAF